MNFLLFVEVYIKSFTKLSFNAFETDFYSKVVREFFLIKFCGCCSVTKSFSTLCNPTDCNMPGSFVLHCLPGFSHSCPLSQWCHLTMSSSAAPFSFFFRSFSTSGASPMSQLFLSPGQSIGASTPVIPMNIQGWFPLGLTDLICLLSKGLSRVFSSTIIQKHWLFSTQLYFKATFTSIYDYWKSPSFDYTDLC